MLARNADADDGLDARRINTLARSVGSVRTPFEVDIDDATDRPATVKALWPDGFHPTGGYEPTSVRLIGPDAAEARDVRRWCRWTLTRLEVWIAWAESRAGVPAESLASGASGGDGESASNGASGLAHPESAMVGKVRQAIELAKGWCWGASIEETVSLAERFESLASTPGGSNISAVYKRGFPGGPHVQVFADWPTVRRTYDRLAVPAAKAVSGVDRPEALLIWLHETRPHLWQTRQADVATLGLRDGRRLDVPFVIDELQNVAEACAIALREEAARLRANQESRREADAHFRALREKRIQRKADSTTMRSPPPEESEAEPPPLPKNRLLVAQTMATRDGELLWSIADIAEAMDPTKRLSHEVIRQEVLHLIASGYANRPSGERKGARLLTPGRRLVAKHKD